MYKLLRTVVKLGDYFIIEKTLIQKYVVDGRILQCILSELGSRYCSNVLLVAVQCADDLMSTTQYSCSCVLISWTSCRISLLLHYYYIIYICANFLTKTSKAI